ncbi:DUF1467 family protein [Celeribacter arenosi]|uniref:DUF1467 family protein n=1 Tax=Celeribacter arenosi TaxID=792649 RepID=A0ABP7K371_9RHOB
MAITSAIVLYLVLWFLTMLVALPIGLRTQGDDGERVEGTHFGAPTNYNPRRKAVIVSIVAAVLWVIVFAVIVYGGFTWRDFDWTARLTPVADS